MSLKTVNIFHTLSTQCQTGTKRLWWDLSMFFLLGAAPTELQSTFETRRFEAAVIGMDRVRLFHTWVTEIWQRRAHGPILWNFIISSMYAIVIFADSAKPKKPQLQKQCHSSGYQRIESIQVSPDQAPSTRWPFANMDLFFFFFFHSEQRTKP